MKKISKQLKICIKCVINKDYCDRFCCITTEEEYNLQRMIKLLAKYNDRFCKKYGSNQ